MQTTEHYRMWHPRDHVWMDWEDKSTGYPRGRASPGARVHRGQDEPATHLVPRPGGEHGPRGQGAGSALRLRSRRHPRSKADRRSPAWSMPPTTPTGGVSSAATSGWGSSRAHFLGGLVQTPRQYTPWLRRRAATHAQAQGLEAHCHEEMSNLGSLPAGALRAGDPPAPEPAVDRARRRPRDVA